MTFIPNVLSTIDNHNSTTTTTTSTIFTGTLTNTTGYNEINIYIRSNQNSVPLGLEIQFSNDKLTWTTKYKDTYFTNTSFYKSFAILDTYYRIIYNTPTATFNIDTRLANSNPNSSNSLTPHYQNVSNPDKDAFGRSRVSEPFTLLDIKFPMETVATNEYLENNMLICSKSSGLGATAVYGSSKCVMTCSGQSTSYINQSRKYCIYQPGKSLLFKGSGIIKSDTTTSSDYNACLGYYDGSNGVFFQQNQNGIHVVLRNNGSDTLYNQNDWNIDTLDGSGSSGIHVDFTKNQLFIIDLEWLSAGRIRFGLYILGNIQYCHQITHLNVLGGPYMTSPNLPIRYELNVNDSGTAIFTQICSTVISEGGYNPIGKPFSASNGTTTIAISSTETPILALRGNMDLPNTNNNYYNHQNIVPTNISIFGTNNADLLFRIRLYHSENVPTVTTWNNVSVNSVSQYALGGTNITNISNQNHLVNSSYTQGKETVQFQSLDNVFSNLLQITSNIDNQSDVLLITAQAFSSSSTAVCCAMNWSEAF